MRLTEEQRNRFAALADRILPAWEKMPAASSVNVHRAMLDLALQVRPDLVEDFSRGLAASMDGTPSEAINRLFRTDSAAFSALNLVATAAYYMTDTVRSIVGYPGQESAPYDPRETPGYLTDGTLERVVRHGSIYRPTPRGEAG
jgi:hypothetical protein